METTKQILEQVLAHFPLLAHKQNLLSARISALVAKPNDEYAWYLNSWADRTYVSHGIREHYRSALQLIRRKVLGH